MGPQERCPVCNRWGSSKLGGYCKTCHSNRYKDDDEKNAFADFVDDHDDGAFFPKKFGILKDKFGYEER
jgi:hypothetical protein